MTIEQIAQAAEVGPATVYRSFGTKERIVLWDEYDPLLLQEVSQELETKPLLLAVETALTNALNRVYEADKRRILRRARLLLSVPSLVAQSALDSILLRGALKEIFRTQGQGIDDVHSSVFAAVVVSLLNTAVELWVADNGRAPLRDWLQQCFAALEKLPTPNEPTNGSPGR